MRLYIIRHGQTEWNQTFQVQGRTDIPLNKNGRELAQKTGAALFGVSFDAAYTSPLIRARETAQIVLAAAAQARGSAQSAGASEAGGAQRSVGTSKAGGVQSAGASEAGGAQRSVGTSEAGSVQSAGASEAGSTQGSAGTPEAAGTAIPPVYVDERLTEISFGVMEGSRVRDEAGLLTDENFVRFFYDTEKYLPPEDGESFQSVIARTGSFLEELKRMALQADKSRVDGSRRGELRSAWAGKPQADRWQADDGSVPQTILISTHGCASRALLANITRCPLRDFWDGGVPKNCALTIVDLVGGEWKIEEKDITYYDNENIGL